MELKKGLILAFALLLISVNIINFLTVITINERITGKATALTEGTSTICISNPPAITHIADQTVTVNQAFALQVQATFYSPATNITYYDNTDLFDIDQTGKISFTPTSTGTHSITITIKDASGCKVVNSTETFSLTISPVGGEAPAPGAGGGAGGGGGGVPVKIEALPKISFQLSEEIIKIAITEAQKLEKKIIIENNGEANVELEIINSLPGVLAVYLEKVSLATGESREIELIFNPYLDIRPNIYSGLITIMATNGTRSISKLIAVVVEVESTKVMFDASLDLAKKTFLPGEELKSIITIFNLKNAIPADVKLLYAITDMNNNVFYEEEEVVSIEEKASFSKNIPITEKFIPGQYVYSLKIVHEDSFATATELFTVEEPPAPLSALAGLAAPVAKRPIFVLAIPFMFLLIIAIVVALYFTHRKVRKAKTKIIIKHKTIIKPRTIIRPIITHDTSTLQRKLALLRESYHKGYIQESTYLKTKSKIEEMIKEQKSKH